MRKRSITLLFLLWTGGFFLLVLTLLFWFAARRAETVMVEEAEDRAHQAVELVDWLVKQRAPFAGEAEFAGWVDRLGQHLGLRVTYIVEGRVLADSDVGKGGVPEMESHATRREVIDALATGFGQDVRVSRTLGREMIYVAAKFGGVPGVPAGILRLALPYTAVKGGLARFRDTTLAVLLGVFLAGGLVAAWLGRGMSRSLTEISGALAAVGEGDFGRRVHVFPAAEFRPLAEAVNVLAEKIGAHVRLIEEQRDRYEAVLDGMAEGVAIIGRNGRIAAHNRALAAMFPKAGELTGRSPIEAGMSLEVEQAIQAFLAADRPLREAGRFPQPGGAVLDLAVVPVTGRKGEKQGIVTFHDVTEVANLERIFRDFVIDASHRLRTPLTKVLGYAETARDMAASDPARAVDAMAVVEAAAMEMRGVIDDLLAVAGTRYAAVRPAPAPVDVAAVLARALPEAAPRLAARGAAARLAESPAGPLPVGIDPLLLGRAFAALLAETPDGAEVAVRVTAGSEWAEVEFAGPAALATAREQRRVAATVEALSGIGAALARETGRRAIRLRLAETQKT